MDENKAQNISIPFEQAGFFHHAMVGKAPEGSGKGYKTLVRLFNPGNRVLQWPVAVIVAAGSLVSNLD